MSLASVQAIMRKRILVPSTFEGKTVVFTVQGDGNVIDVKDKAGELVFSTIAGYEGIVLQKKIFNLRANSQVGMTNPRTVDYLRTGIAAEKAGNIDAAHEAFNEYLNACQMNVGILLPNAKAEKLSDGMEISAKVQLVTTDNGSLLTIDPSTISVVAPERLGTTTFNIDDYLPKETEEEKVAREKAEKIAAGAKTTSVKKALKA